MKIDIHNKKYQTITNLPVRFYSDDGSEDGPIHGAVKSCFGWKTAEWYTDGLSSHNEEWSLEEVVTFINGFMNIYPKVKDLSYECGEIYFDKKDAEDHARGESIGYIEINTPLKQWEIDL